MDANRQRFWLLADERHYALAAGAAYDDARRALSLASQRTLPTFDTEDQAYEDAYALGLTALPEVLDRFGVRGHVATDGSVVGDAAAGEMRWLDTNPLNEAVRDLVLGLDDVLYVAYASSIWLVDLRQRWAPTAITLAGFSPWRLAPAPGGGVWAIEETAAGISRVARSTGHPLPDGLQLTPGPGVFRPDPEDPRPPKLTRVSTADLKTDGVVVSIASDPDGRLAALVLEPEGPAVRVLEGGRWLTGAKLGGVDGAYDIAWFGADRWAILAPLLEEAPVYPVTAPGDPDDDPVLPLGDYHPLVGYDGGRFVRGPLGTPTYLTTDGIARPVRRLSLPSRARQAMVGVAPESVFDGGRARFPWHRLILEADLPPMCAVRIHLAATETRDPPALEPDAEGGDAHWFTHSFGDDRDVAHGVPRGARMPASELPFHPGLLPCPDRPTSAFYTALVQRAGHTTRTLRGRFLHTRIELIGDGRATPEVAAVRVYGARFSLVENYLPELYRETVYGDDAHAPADRTTGADFLERFVGLFEGILTPIEDRIAHAHLLTDPATAPDEALDWLAGWVGLTLHPAIPPERRRALIAAAVPLARRRGTLNGLERAVDLVTGGAVERGEVVIVEDFRLRRTFATILGADLRAVDDALTGGLTVTGNSIVGDTLMLGRPERKAFLALFSDDLDRRPDEEAAVEALYADLAWRVTVLVQREQGLELLGLVRRTVARCTPAHVEARVVAASHPLVVGVQSLVGVDTYLGQRAPLQPVRIGHDRVGTGARRVLAPPSLDPDLAYGSAPATDPQGEP